MGGGKSTSTTAPRLNGINIQSSVFGSAIPRGWGTFRVPANLLWYGDFQAIATTTKTKTGGKGGGGTNKTTTYSYKAALILGICAGPIAAIRTVYKDQSVFAGWSALSQAGLSLMAGYDGQATWGHLTTRHPDKAIGYSGIAYAYASAYALSDSAVVSNHSFEVVMPDLVAGSDDASPRLIVEQFLSEIPGWPSGVLSDLSDYGDYCLASGLLLSPVLTAQVQAAEFLKDVLRATNSEAFMSEGKVKITPYGDTEVTGNGVTWTPDLTPIYDLDDTVFIPPSEGDDPLTFDLKRPADAFNIVQVEYLDRGHQYAVAMAPGVDQASIDQFGARKADPARLHVICDSGVADKVADLLVRRTAGMRTTFSFRLPWNYVLLDPMDLVTVTDLAQGIDRVLVRVLEVNESDDEYEIVCEEMLVGQAAQALIVRQPMDGYRPNWDAAPGDALAPVMFNPPRQLTDGALEVWLATAGGADWGGAEVWASIDGSTYERKGQVNGPSRFGVTTSALPLNADPDATNAVAVDISASGGELTPATQEEVDDFATLCLIGDEVIAYRDATLTGTGQYTLGYLRRGLMGTTPAAHASGTRFVRLDGAVESLPYRDDQIGLELYIKLRSFNIHGRAYQELDEVDPYTVTLDPSPATYVPVTWPEIGDRPPVLTDLDPDGRLRPGNVGGVEPGETLYQSLSSILVDVQDLVTTYGDTASAAASAAAADAAADAATAAASAADTAATIAGTARDIATGARDAAIAARDVATSARDTAIAEADAAAGSAGTAAGHASTASSAASTATGAATASEASAVVARSNAVQTFPSDFAQDGRYFSPYPAYGPENPIHTAPTPGWQFQTAGGVKYLRTSAEGAPQYMHVRPVGVRAAIPGKSFRQKVRVRNIGGHADTYIQTAFYGLTADYLTIIYLNGDHLYDVWSDIGTSALGGSSSFFDLDYGITLNATLPGDLAWIIAAPYGFTPTGTMSVDWASVTFEDVTESRTSLGWATASASSAASAATSSDDAGAYAAAALQDRLDAQTARGGAEAARDASVSARDTAQGHAAAAASSAGLSAGSATDSGNSATASANSASAALSSANAAGDSAASASDSAGIAATARDASQNAASASADSAATAQSAATAAGTSASAASADRVLAETARGQAQTAAANAASSETGAAGSASAAATSASVSATAGTASRLTAASLFPNTFTNDGATWAVTAWTASPAATPPLSTTPNPHITFPDDPVFGKLLRVAVPSSSDFLDVFPVGAVKLVPGRKWRFSTRVRAQTWSSGPVVEFYVVGLNADYQYISGVNDARSWGATTAVPTTGSPYASNWGDLSFEPDVSGWIGTFGAVYVRPLLRFRLGGAGNVYDAAHLTVEDVTESTAAGGYAAASASSASQALASESAAGSSATSATTQANNASTAAGQALAYRDQSASSASSASGSAVAAQSSATLSAAVASSSLIGNVKFSDWSIPYSSGWPYPWATADNNMGAGSSVTQVAGEVPGTYAAQVVGGAGANAYSAQITPVGSAVSNGFYVAEAEVRLDAGTLDGAGMYFVATDQAGSGLSSEVITFTTDPNNNTGVAIGGGVVGQTYRFAKLVQAGSGGGVSRIRFYTMNHWTTHGSIAVANTLTWYKCNIRPATADEIELRQARGAAPSLAARITDVANVAASATSAVATRTSTLEAQVQVNENRLRNPSGAAGMLNWPNAGAAITWSAYVHPVWGSWITGHTYAGGGGTGDAYIYQDYDAEASTWYTLSGWAYCQADGPSWFAYVEFYTSGGSYITGNSRSFLPAGGNSAFTPWSFQTPAGCARVRFYTYWASPAVNQQVGFSRLKLEVGQVATTYSDDATTRATLSRVSVSEGAIATLNGRNAAWLQQQVEAGSGAAAFVRLYAETSPGVQTSDVSIGAREIHLFNQTTAGFLRALSVVGGNAIFYGGLTAATFIRQGSGEGWPVALAQKDFVGGDGATFSWGLTFDNFPSYIAAMNNLAALTAGETYDVRLNVTKTGATVIAKIITPGSPTNYGPITPDYAGGTSAPDYIVGVTSASRGESSDGTYDLNIYSSWTTSYYANFTGEVVDAVDNGGSGSVYVDVFALKSGVWTLVSTELFYHYAYPSGYMFHGWNAIGSDYSQTVSVQMGTGVQAIGLQYNSIDGAYGPYAGGSAALNSASWQAPGTSSTTRSATPSGQTTRFTVIPK